LVATPATQTVRPSDHWEDENGMIHHPPMPKYVYSECLRILREAKLIPQDKFAYV